MELYGPSKCTKLTHPNGRWSNGPPMRLSYVTLDRLNGRRSNGPPMLCQFGPSKWTTVEWTAYVTSIWTVQMEDGPMDRLCYVNLDRLNGRRSNGPSMLRQFGPSKWTTVHWTVVHLNGPLDHLYLANLNSSKLWSWTVILDSLKIRMWTVILALPKLRLGTVILDCQKEKN